MPNAIGFNLEHSVFKRTKVTLKRHHHPLEVDELSQQRLCISCSHVISSHWSPVPLS